jgi:hypothetical protein
MLKSSDLPKRWSAPDNSRLTTKQFSFRLPVHVAAKLAALEEMFPNKTRTEIVGDLLTAALEDVEASFPFEKGRAIGEHSDTGETIYENVGPSREFRNLADKYYVQLERELGNENPRPLYDMDSQYRNAREGLS